MVSPDHGGTTASCNCNLTSCNGTATDCCYHSQEVYYLRYELTPELMELLEKPPPIYEKVRKLFSKYFQTVLIYCVERKSRAPPEGLRL